ncbi:hypothetical protein PAMP_018483 [Pampus punctatissimus]
MPDLNCTYKPPPVKCNGFNPRAFRWAQTMRLAVEEINQNTELLPNYTLGYKIIDSCEHPLTGQRAALAVLNGLSEEHSPMCSRASPLLAVIGESGSAQSIVVSRILQPFRIPMISYFSTCSCFADRIKYPNFFRVIPNDDYQVKAIAQLLVRFNWTWVGLVRGDHEYGRFAVQGLMRELQGTKVCVAYQEMIPLLYNRQKVLEVLQVIQSSTAKVVVLFSAEGEMTSFLRDYMMQNITGIQWVASEAWVTASVFTGNEYYPYLGGTIGFGIRKGHISRLGDYLLTVNPQMYPSNPLVQELWEALYGCSPSLSSGSQLPPCLGQESLLDQHSAYMNTSSPRVAYNVYKAVYAIAHSLHNLLLCQPDQGPFLNNSCAQSNNIKPWQLQHYIQKVTFNFAGEEVNFDLKGDSIPYYDIINWQRGTSGNIEFVNVGLFDGTKPAGEKLVIQEDTIVWAGHQSEVPVSVCSASCPPGSRKAVRRGEPVCCFDCVPCDSGKISNQTNSIECTFCPEDFWSNDNRTACIPKKVEFLAYDSLGLLVSDDDYGLHVARSFQSDLAQSGGGCLAYLEVLPWGNDPAERRRIVEVMKKSTARVVMVFAHEIHIYQLMEEVVRQNVTGLQWMASEAWTSVDVLQTPAFMPYLGGTIGIAIRRGEIAGLKDFLFRIHPDQHHNNYGNSIVNQFWEFIFQCKFAPPPAGWVEAGGALCTGQENLHNVESELFDVSNLRPEYNVYKAVYALAYALDDMLQCVPGRGPFSGRSCASLQRLEPWQLVYYLDKVNFITPFGDQVTFDVNGDALPIYDVMNWLWLPNGTTNIQNVGEVKESHKGRFRHAMTMAFAIEEINSNSNLLPNVTLGYSLYDNCATLVIGFSAALSLASGREEQFLLQETCLGTPPVLGIVGDSFSTFSIATSDVIGLFKLPIVSYFATCSCLSDRKRFPSFFRTIPSDAFQVRAMIQILKRFGWTWAGLLVSDDDYGLHVARSFQSDLAQSGGGCLAYSEILPWGDNPAELRRIVEVMKTSTARVVIVFAHQIHMIQLMEEVVKQNVTGLQWLASEAWTAAAVLQTPRLMPYLGGTLGIAIRRGEIAGLRDFLLRIRPDLHHNNSYENNMVRQFWEHTFQCRFAPHPADWVEAGGALCTGDEDLENVETEFLDVSNLRPEYNIYKAVYALAYALDNMLQCVPGRGPFSGHSCATLQRLEPWQLMYYLEKVNFTTSFGDQVSFDVNGDALPIYDIMNWQWLPNKRTKVQNVGVVKKSAFKGEELTLDEDRIYWNFDSKQPPRSVCSESCPPGTRMARKKGQPVCCFDCIPCSEGKFSNETDSMECKSCPEDFWSSPQRDHCVLKKTEFLSYHEPLGICLTSASLLGTFICAFILGIFIYHRSTPMVRANNSELSFLLLVSLKLCFLCSLLFIGRPRLWTCQLRHAAFGISFVLCVSCILVKTMVVVAVFKASKPGGGASLKWFGAVQQRGTVLVLTSIQAAICTAWLVSSSPAPHKNTQYHNDKIVYECVVGSTIWFAVLLGYIGVLAILSFLLAFLARNLPDNFNEAKLITFSMLIFCAVWVAFVPAYVNSPGKYADAVEVFAILASSFGLLVALFGPKCYIILLRPERNTKKAIMGRGTTKT